jgi:hypothetical protein
VEYHNRWRLIEIAELCLDQGKLRLKFCYPLLGILLSNNASDHEVERALKLAFCPIALASKAVRIEFAFAANSRRSWLYFQMYASISSGAFNCSRIPSSTALSISGREMMRQLEQLPLSRTAEHRMRIFPVLSRS